MWIYVALAAVFVILIVARVAKLRRTIGGAGDLVSVKIPRSLERGTLVMGTRLEVAAALKKGGTPIEEVRALIEQRDDAELLRRYWAMRDGKPSETPDA